MIHYVRVGASLYGSGSGVSWVSALDAAGLAGTPPTTSSPVSGPR